MIQAIQKRPQWQRVIIFAALVAAVIVVIFVITLGVGYLGVNAGPRNQSIAMQDNLTVREWVTLPDDDSYPAALTIDPEGNVYTGSYITGAIWRIKSNGAVTELPKSRDTFGSIAGLDWGSDGMLYVLDRHKSLDVAGMTLWRWKDGQEAESLFEANDSDRIPYDLASDQDGNLYVSFIVIGSEGLIMRYPPNGTPEVWWKAPANTTITGITYDQAQNRLIAIDTKGSDLYAIPRDDPKNSTLLYHSTVEPQPGFDDAVVGPDGTLYLSALSLNRVAALSPKNDLIYLAGAFRGSSRVAYDAARHRLYVNNWDQRSLLADQMLFVQIDVTPKLPFALDVIEWK